MGERSVAQFATLQAIALFSSTLSIIGSSLIIVSIFKQHKQQKKRTMNTLHQLLLGLCMSDISCTLVTLTLGVTNPKEFRDMYPWSRGNQFTCNAFASLYILAQTAAYFYSMFMSLYFYRIVTVSKKRSNSQQKRREWWFLLASHSISNVIPLLLVIAGLITNSYHPHDFIGFCYYSEYPYGCDKDPEVQCEGGQKAFLIGRIRTGIITIIALISITATIMLALHVWRNIERSSRYSVTRRPVFYRSGEMSTTSIRSSRSQAQRAPPPKNRKQREVAKQAIWYMLASINSFLFMVVSGVIYNVTNASENKGGAGPFTLFVFLYFFQPLQGALNFIVFIRPRYKAWKIQFEKQHKRDPENNPIMPFRVILKKAIMEQVPSIGQQPRPKERKANHDNDTNASHLSGQQQESTVQPQHQPLQYASEEPISFNAGRRRSSRYVPATIPENFDLSDNGNVDDIVIEFKSNSFLEDESSFNDVDESQIFGIDQDDTSEHLSGRL